MTTSYPRRERNVKIVATLGPSSTTYEQIDAIYRAGVDVFRFNFSHGEHAEHAARMEIVRRIERESGRPIGVMACIISWPSSLLARPWVIGVAIKPGPMALTRMRGASSRAKVFVKFTTAALLAP